MSHPTARPVHETIDDARAVELWGRVVRGFQTTQRRLFAAIKAEFELGEAEVETLLSLHRCPSFKSRHNSLAQGAGLSTGGFTKIADKLTGRGLTIRTACAEDRRVSYLELTESGAALAAELTAAVAKLNRTVFIEVLGEQQATAVSDAMATLYRANFNK